MPESNFIDYVKIHCQSGNGGAGSRHYHRSKISPKGGPDGGDGGKGGDIVLVGNHQLWTLLHLKYRKHIKAGHGNPGGESHSQGKSGETIVLEVPLGTVAKDFETGEVLFEITEDGEQKVLLPGVEVAWVTRILLLQQTKLRNTHNQGKMESRNG